MNQGLVHLLIGILCQYFSINICLKRGIIIYNPYASYYKKTLYKGRLKGNRVQHYAYYISVYKTKPVLDEPIPGLALTDRHYTIYNCNACTMMNSGRTVTRYNSKRNISYYVYNQGL